jgi:hypothetical protein
LISLKNRIFLSQKKIMEKGEIFEVHPCNAFGPEGNKKA